MYRFTYLHNTWLIHMTETVCRETLQQVLYYCITHVASVLQRMPDAVDNDKREEERCSMLKAMTCLHEEIFALQCVLTNNLSRDDDGENEDSPNLPTESACLKTQRKTEEDRLVILQCCKCVNCVYFLLCIYSYLFIYFIYFCIYFYLFIYLFPRRLMLW